MGLKINPEAAAYNNIHCAILTGMLSHIARKTETNEYAGARNNRLYVFPGSSQFRKNPEWIVAAELVETSRLYARTVARIDPKWLLKTAGHLIKREYFEPFWDQRSRHVKAYERVTLYGLTIISRREVEYGTIDPAEARRFFIRHALVDGEYETRARFFRHNRKLTEQLKTLEKKTRRMDVLDEEAIYQYYDKHIPAQVCDGPGFEKWYRQAGRDNKQLLLLAQDDIMQHPAGAVTAVNYPDRYQFAHTSLPLNYEFRPGDEHDGVTLKIPLQMLNQINTRHCEYLVPGLLEEKIQYLIKALPKNLRKNFVPVPETARCCALEIIPGEQSLLDSVSEYLFRKSGIEIPDVAWRSDGLLPHLLMNFCIIDETGSILAEGRDLEKIRRQLGEQAETRLASISSAIQNRDDITRWDFGDLPEVICIDVAGVIVHGYPALLDRQESVALRLLDTAEKAQRQTQAGLRRLFMLELSKEMKYLRKSLPDIKRMCMHYTAIGPGEELIEDLLQVITGQIFLEGQPLLRTESEFTRRKQEGSKELIARGNQLCATAGEILEKANRLRTRLTDHLPAAWADSINDIREHLDALVYRGFIRYTPVQWLRCYPRYLDAIEKRLDKLQYSQSRDEIKLREVRPLREHYRKLAGKQVASDNHCPELETYRWMLEEYCVSLFAQELGTLFPVSLQRMERQWQVVQRETG